MMATRRVTEHEIGKALLLILGLVVLAIYSFALSINVSFLTGLKVAGGVALILFLFVENWKAKKFDQGICWFFAVPLFAGSLGILCLPILDDWSAVSMAKPDFGMPWGITPWYTNSALKMLICLAPGFVTWGVLLVVKKVTGKR